MSKALSFMIFRCFYVSDSEDEDAETQNHKATKRLDQQSGLQLPWGYYHFK